MITRNLPKFVASVMIAALAFSATACSTEPSTDGELTLEVAKFRTMAFERDLAAFVPDGIQGQRRQNEFSSIIYPCLGQPGMAYWPGALTIALKGDFDSDDILDAMERKWADKEGWTVVRKVNNEKIPYLEMSTAEGYRFTVAFFGGPQFSINSFSACFTEAGLEDYVKY